MHADLYHRSRPTDAHTPRLVRVAMVDLDPLDEVAATLDRACALALDGGAAWAARPDLRSVAAGDVVVLDGAAAFEATADGWSRVPVPEAGLVA